MQINSDWQKPRRFTLRLLPAGYLGYLLRFIMIEYHRCNDLNKLTGIEIVYSIFYGEVGEEPNWWFHSFREANEKDVDDGEAENIGESMFSTAVVISFCPFCGKRLKNS